ncbi:MAG TPA: acyl-CoA dehydrogenase family protein [Candidatus Wallbacteria bacterium]|nr:acyl-CoA dehydrogenase family protein [Candidatus Wallbacteria bacterium]
MNFEFNEEQIQVRDMAREFAQNEIAPNARQYDEKAEFPWPVIKKMAELNLLGMMIPEQYGGMDFDATTVALVIEEISKADAACGVILAVQNSLGSSTLVKYGSEELKAKYLPSMASGEKLCAFGLTEAGAGSDFTAMTTVAEDKGDHWLINGRKCFITNGSTAETFTIIAMTDKKKGARGMSAFIVEKSFPGFSVGTIEKKLGIRASDTTEIIFDNIKVPKENLIGKKGYGYIYAMEALDTGRVGVGAQALGIAEAAYDAALKYSKTRIQWGAPISKLQAIQFKFADMATKIEATRLLVYRAAYLKDAGKPYVKEASMAKVFASEMATFVTHQAMQVMGGYGYMKEYNIERYYRDARITEIYEGTSEVQRHVIASLIMK